MHRFGLAAPTLAILCLTPSVRADEPATGYIILPNDTRLKIDGFIQVYGSYFHNQNLYDNGSLLASFTDPLNARATPDKQISFTARTTRFGFTAITPTERLGEITTRIEMDFAKERGFSGTPHLRHAYLSFGRWIVGHTWSNWLDEDATATTVDFNGPIGQACNDTARYTQLRYTYPLARKTTLAFSVEKNTTSHGQFPDGTFPGQPPAPAPGNSLPDARYPSLVAACTYKDDWGHVAIRGLGQHYGAYTPGTANSPNVRSNRWAGAVQLSGTLKVTSRDSLVASYYTGQALGPYGVGIQAAVYDLGAGKVRFYRNSGWQAGYGHAWNSRVRSNLVASGVHYKNDNSTASTIREARNYFANTFVQLSKSLEAGLEYGYEDLRTFGPAVVQRDGSMSNKNRSNKLQVSLTAKF